MKKNLILCAFLVLVLCLCVNTASATTGLADSPQPKFHHDQNNTGQSQYSGPQTNNLKWKYKTGSGVASSPVIAPDGTIYVGSFDKNLYAFSPTGTVKWKYTTGGGVGSSPAIDKSGNIYFGSDDKYVYAVTSSGALKWKYLTGDKVRSSPAIGSDGTIYIGSNDKNFYALSTTGALKWKYLNNGAVSSSPAIGSDGTIYFGDSDNLYLGEYSYFNALNPTGNLKWRTQIGYYYWEGGVTTSPAIAKDGTIYFGCYGWLDKPNYLIALNSANGAEKWKYQAGGLISSSPAVANDGTIYFGCDDKYLYSLSSTGVLKWKFGTGNTISSSPTIDKNGNIYFGGNDGFLYALSPIGALKWKYDITPGVKDDPVQSSPAIGSDGTLYVGKELGETYFFAIKDPIIPPAISSIDPANNAVSVARDKIIKITFNKPVLWGNFWIELKNSIGTIIPIKKSITGNVLTITPSILLATGTKYTVYLHTGCVKDYAGNPLAGITKSFTTTTDGKPPTVTATDPVNNAVNVARNKVIKVTFSEPVKWGSFWIELKNSSGTVIPITKSITGNVLTITPSVLLATGTKYIIALHTGCVKDYAGNPLAGVTRTFTTYYTDIIF